MAAFSVAHSSSVKHCRGSCLCGPIFVITKRGHTAASWTAMNVSCPLASRSVIDGARTNLFRTPTLSSLQRTQPRAMVAQLTSSTTAKKYVIHRKEFLRRSFVIINWSCSYESPGILSLIVFLYLSVLFNLVSSMSDRVLSHWFVSVAPWNIVMHRTVYSYIPISSPIRGLFCLIL